MGRIRWCGPSRLCSRRLSKYEPVPTNPLIRSSFGIAIQTDPVRTDVSGDRPGSPATASVGRARPRGRRSARRRVVAGTRDRTRRPRRRSGRSSHSVGASRPGRRRRSESRPHKQEIRTFAIPFRRLVRRDDAEWAFFAGRRRQPRFGRVGLERFDPRLVDGKRRRLADDLDSDRGFVVRIGASSWWTRQMPTSFGIRFRCARVT